MKKGYLIEEQIKEIEEKIGYTFKDKNLLSTAFRRKSYTEELGNDATNLPNNETLEFYGDSALNLIVVKALANIASKSYNDDVKPERNEEALTHFVSNYTDKSMLASIIEPTGLSKYLIMSKGDIEKEVYKEESVMEDLFESIVGAMWFDNDLDIDAITFYVARMLDLKTDREDFYKKNEYVQLKEFMDRNPEFSIRKISGVQNLYIGEEPAGFYLPVGGILPGMGRYQTMISNAKLFIEFLKKNNYWDLDTKIDIDGITPENAINKLQELYQKKIIKSNPIYPKENEFFDRETNLWNVDCVYIETGNLPLIETGEGKQKSDAKKLAAYKMYMSIANNYNG